MSNTSNSLIHASGLRKTYKLPRSTVKVLDGAALDVAEGETLSIIGVSGAGKSTLLHILGGLDRPDEGSIRFGGEDLYELSGRRRSRIRATRIGFVFQSYHLLPEMDVCENVLLPAMARGGVLRGYRAMRGRAMELLEAVGLADRADHMPMELSGGEQQRVALARALMNDPDVVLADEPTGNLDSGTGGQILDYLFELSRGRGHTLVLVTHDAGTATSCDRSLRLEDGRLVGA